MFLAQRWQFLYNFGDPWRIVRRHLSSPGNRTRLGGAVGMLLMVNYALAWGNSFLVPTGNWMWFGQFAAILLMAQGRILSLDAILHRRWPKALVW